MAKWEAPGAKSRPNPLAIRVLLTALMEGPHTYADLAEASGLHEQTVRHWLVPFRKRVAGLPRVVHIAEWHPDPRGYPTRPAFAWGDKPDAKRRALSNAERQRRVRQRQAAMREVQRMIQATAGVA